MSCDLCSQLKGTQLINHYQNKHAPLEFIYKKGENEKVIAIQREPELGLLCPFSCGLSYETRRGIEKHLKMANSSCSRPSYDNCFMCLIRGTPYDTKEVEVPSLRSYNDSIVMAVSNNQHTVKEMKMTTRMVRALGLVPFGMYLSSGREINSLACKEVVDCLVNEYDGQQIYFSTKEDIEDVQDELPISNKNPKSVFCTNIQFSSRVLTGPFSFFFSQKKYFQLNEELSEKLNYCWNEHPQMKYFATMLFTGAVLFRIDTGESLIINTVETYGRTEFLDDHSERNNESLPPNKKTRYQYVWPLTLDTKDGKKLVIGTKTLNILVTGSTNISNNRLPELGPSTHSFTLNNFSESYNTKIFVNEECYQDSMKIAEDPTTDRIDSSNSLYQLRQLRSKFHKPSTYMKLRYTFQDLDALKHQPVTIFTFGNHTKKKKK